MSVRSADWLRRIRMARVPSLYGAWMVFRYQMRGRNAWRDLGWTLVLLALLLAVSAVLQVTWAQANLYSGLAPEFLLRWLTVGAAGAPFLFLPCAAVLGARAVPPTVEFESTQSALMTRLTAFDLVVGRLFAALWPLISTTLASCAFWLIAQLIERFVPGWGNGFGPIFVAHFVLLCSVSMIGAIAFWGATRRRPGRNWGRGTGVALIVAALCVTGILLINPQINRMKKPGLLIEASLLINPISAVSRTFDQDILRNDWLYQHSDAPEYLFQYPAPSASAACFLLVSLTATSLAALCLRRAYR